MPMGSSSSFSSSLSYFTITCFLILVSLIPLTLILSEQSAHSRALFYRNAQVQVWLAPVPFQSCVGAIANRGQWEQGCSLLMATDLGPVRATCKKKKGQRNPSWKALDYSNTNQL